MPRNAIGIVTYNRAHLIQKVFESLKHSGYEKVTDDIFIVINGCTDNTIEKINEYKEKLPIRMIVSEKNIFINGGVSLLRAAVSGFDGMMFYTDDDIFHFSNWVVELKKSFEEAEKLLSNFWGCGVVLGNEMGIYPDIENTTEKKINLTNVEAVFRVNATIFGNTWCCKCSGVPDFPSDLHYYVDNYLRAFLLSRKFSFGDIEYNDRTKAPLHLEGLRGINGIENQQEVLSRRIRELG